MGFACGFFIWVFMLVLCLFDYVLGCTFSLGLFWMVGVFWVVLGGYFGLAAVADLCCADVWCG